MTVKHQKNIEDLLWWVLAGRERDIAKKVKYQGGQMQIGRATQFMSSFDKNMTVFYLSQNKRKDQLTKENINIVMLQGKMILTLQIYIH